MPQHATPTRTKPQLRTEATLLTTTQLKDWLGVSKAWIYRWLDDPEFVDRCVINLAAVNSQQRNLRFPDTAVAEFFGIPTDTALLNTKQLMHWLGVGRDWVKDRVKDPEFVERCVINIATKGSSLRKLRFPASAVAEWRGIPADATPKAA